MLSESRDGIEIGLDQSPGARERFNQGLHRTKITAAATFGAVGVFSFIDIKASAVAGILGLSAILVESVETTVPYLDNMEFTKQPAEEVILTENIQTEIS